MQKLCAKMVLQIITCEQQQIRKNVCTNTSNTIGNDPNFWKV